MSIEFITPDLDDLTPRITVVGVGGAGGNAIANMMRADVQGVNFLVANTDNPVNGSTNSEQTRSEESERNAITSPTG